MYQKQTLHFEDNDKAFSCIELKKKIILPKNIYIDEIAHVCKIGSQIVFRLLGKFNYSNPHSRNITNFINFRYIFQT